LEHEFTVPISSANPHGAIKAASLTLSGAYMIPVDVPDQDQGSVERYSFGEHISYALSIKNKQVGLFYKDTVDDLSMTKNAFLLALQDEPLLPWERNEFQAKQDGLMIDLVMGIIVTQDGSETDTYRRIGLARWNDAELLFQSGPRTVKLV
jgi:hypothetical protein